VAGSRRVIIGARVFACVSLLSCGSNLSDDTGSTPLESTDVVIVGGGVAGMTAALLAQEAGAEVLLIERSDLLGGAARYARMMLFSGTPLQTDAGVEDSPEALLQEWSTFTGGDPSDPWLLQYAEQNVGEVFEWLQSVGVEFTLLDQVFYASGTVPRMHEFSTGSSHLVDVLESRCDESRLRLSTEVTALVEQEGRVVGVEIDSAESGLKGWIEAEAVVMATGSFLRDDARVREARPDLADIELWNASNPESDGSGLALVETLGGVTENLSAIGIYIHGTADPREGSEGEELGVDDVNAGIWVNAQGERFFDEKEFNSFRPGEAAITTADGLVWLVLDNSEAVVLLDAMQEEHESDDLDLEELIASGFAAESLSLADLALEIGVDATNLESTVAAYNLFANGEQEDEWRSGLEPAVPIEEPPFLAVRLVPSTAKAFGGVDVDLQGRVVDAAGEPIPGLYAAGELTGMAGGSLVGDLGFSGSLSAVVLSGKVAGRTAGTESLEGR